MTILWGDLMSGEAFPERTTERLELCELTRDHVDWYLEHFSIPEIVAGQGFPAPESRKVAEEELGRYIVGLFERGEGFRWGIRLKGDTDIIGSVGLYSWDKENARASAGYDLRPAYWGKGIMAEALREVLSFGFEEMGLNRIQVTIMSNNPRSMALAERVGFTREGVMKEYSRFDGEYRDEHVFGILRREWKAGRDGSG